MRKLAEWLETNGVSVSVIEDILIASRTGSLSVQPFAFAQTDRTAPDAPEAQWLDAYVRPALPRVQVTRQQPSKDPHAGARLLDLAHATSVATHGRDGFRRTLCGFVGQLLVIQLAQNSDQTLFEVLRDAWQRRNDAFLGPAAFAAAKSLGDSDVAVIENAMARLMAVYLIQFDAGDWAAALFDGAEIDLPFDQMAARAGMVPNNMPPFPDDTDAGSPAARARRIGAMALLDMCYWRGRASQDIATYFTEAACDVDRDTLHIATDQGNKPVGYATWSTPPQGKGTLIVTRQTAPFGDHRHLLNDLKRRFRDAEHATALHPDSARTEQVIW